MNNRFDENIKSEATSRRHAMVQLSILSVATAAGIAGDAYLDITTGIPTLLRTAFAVAGAVTVNPLRRVTDQEYLETAPIRGAGGAFLMPITFATNWATTWLLHRVYGKPDGTSHQKLG